MSERKASMGDKVYRGDVVKFIRNNISLGTFMKRTVKTANEACWDLCDKLNYVPAIEEKPEPHWISVTERLPELRHDVLLTVFFHERWNVAEGYRQDGEFMFWNNGRLDSVLDEENRVIAWMPKPEPYKGVTE